MQLSGKLSHRDTTLYKNKDNYIRKHIMMKTKD